MTNESFNGKSDKTQFDLVMTNPDFNANLLALCSEMTDFTKRALDLRLAFAAKMLGCASINNAFEAQSEYAKTYVEGSLAQATKIGKIYADLTKAAFKKPGRRESV